VVRLSKATQNLKPYIPGPSLEEIRTEYGLEDLVLLAANEYWEGPFPEVLAALQQALPALNRYPDQDCAELRALLCGSLGVDAGRLMFGTGSCELLKLLGTALVDPGDHMVFPEPSFVVYRLIALELRAAFAAVPLDAFTVDLEAMSSLIDERTRLVIICNPNNPTGTYLSVEEIEGFLGSIPSDVTVVLDEAYGEFVTTPSRRDTVPLIKTHPNLVILRTFSKIYGLAGLRVGYGIAHPDLVAAVDMLRQPYNVTSLAQVAAAEAFRHQERVSERREYVHRERATLYEDFARLGVACVPSQANFVLVNVEGLPVPGEEVPRSLLAQGIMTRSGYFFGCPGWIRVTVGSRSENEALLQVFESIAGRSRAA